MEYYPYALQFPFSKTILNFRELTCYEQSVLSKINITLPPSPEYRTDYQEVLSELFQSTLKNKNNINDLDIVEFLMFAVRLRAVSIGSFLEFTVGDEEEKKKKIKFDLYSLLKNIYDIGQIIYDFDSIESDDVEVKLKWPDLKGEFHFLSLISKDNTEKFLSTMCEFVEYLKIKGQMFNFKSFGIKEREELFDLLPISVKNMIQTNIISLLQKISEMPLFELQEFESYKFEFYNSTIQDIIRFIFANDENSLMIENIFLLNKGFTITDIDKMSPVMKQNYINHFIEQDNNKNSEVQ
jgi:hypothetical protein